MAKDCRNCGIELEDEAAFCMKCGAEQSKNTNEEKETIIQNEETLISEENIVKSETEKDKKQGVKKKAIIIGTITAIVVLLITTLIILLNVFDRGYKIALDNFVKVCEKGDVNAYLDMEFPKKVQKVFNKSEIEDIPKNTNDELEDEFGRNLKVNYTITYKERLEKDDFYDKTRSYFDISTAYLLDVEFEIEGKDSSNIETVEVIVAEVDGDWILVNGGYRDLMPDDEDDYDF